MAGEWTPTVLRNHVELLVGFAFKSERFQTRPPGIRLVRGDNVTEGSIRWGDKTRYWPELTPDLRRYQLRSGDVLIGMDGSKVGRNWTRVRDADVPCLLVQRVACLRANNTLDQSFLAALISSQMFKDHIDAVKTGSSIPHMSGRQIGEFVFRIPALVEQRAIAHILGTLDDKIELIWRMNKALEAMAQALFKSWFVDFDPIHAKAEGRDPGLPKHFAELFPGSFEDSELGEIPAGWGVGPLLRQASLLSGGTPKTDRGDYWNGHIPWASAKDISQCSQTFLTETERTVTTKGLEESSTRLIPAFCTAVVARGATTGRMVLFGREIAMNQTCYALASTSGTPFALYCQLRHSIDDLVHTAHGSVFDTITTNTFANANVILPTTPILQAFEKAVSPLFQRMLVNTEESRTLAALRDVLLPKLLSGEIRVKDPTGKKEVHVG